MNDPRLGFGWNDVAFSGSSPPAAHDVEHEVEVRRPAAERPSPGRGVTCSRASATEWCVADRRGSLRQPGEQHGRRRSCTTAVPSGTSRRTVAQRVRRRSATSVSGASAAIGLGLLDAACTSAPAPRGRRASDRRASCRAGAGGSRRGTAASRPGRSPWPGRGRWAAAGSRCVQRDVGGVAVVAVGDQQPRIGQRRSPIASSCSGSVIAQIRCSWPAWSTYSAFGVCRCAPAGSPRGSAAGPRWTSRIGAGLIRIVAHPARPARRPAAGGRPRGGRPARSRGVVARCETSRHPTRPRTVSPESEYSWRYTAGLVVARGQSALAQRLQPLRRPHGRVARRRGPTPDRRRAAEPAAGPGRAAAGAGRRRTAGPWGTGLHRCIVGATTKELDGGWTARRDASRTSYDLVMFDLDGVVYVDGARGRARGREHRAVAREAGRAHRVHHQQRVADPRAGGRRTCASWASAASPGRRRHLLAGGGTAAGRRRTAPGRRSPCWAADGLVEALREAGLEPVQVGRPDGRLRSSPGYAPDVRWRDDHAGRGR